MTDVTPLQAHLVNFVMILSMGAMILDNLSPKNRIHKMQALALATSDEIKKRVETGDESELMAMIIVSRKHLKQVRALVLQHPIPTQAAKARTEWLTNTKALLRQTEGIGND